MCILAAFPLGDMVVDTSFMEPQEGIESIGTSLPGYVVSSICHRSVLFDGYQTWEITDVMLTRADLSAASSKIIKA